MRVIAGGQDIDRPTASAMDMSRFENEVLT